MVTYKRKSTGYIISNDETLFSDEWKKKTHNTRYEDMK